MVWCLLQVGGEALKSMTSLIELFGPDGSTALIDTRGAALVGLKLKSTEVMPNCASKSARAFFAGSTLAPWANRIAGGEWLDGDQARSYPANDGLGNANHGLVTCKRFRLDSVQQNRVQLSRRVPKSKNYPYQIRVSVTYSLTELGLQVAMAAKNQGVKTAPFGMGSHPYFAIPSGGKLTINARQVGLNPVAMIPARWGGLGELGMQTGVPHATAGLMLDHEFSDLVGQPSECVITYPSNERLTIWQEREFSHLMIYTAKVFPWNSGDAPAIAIEPQTCAIDAFNNRRGLIELAAGAEFSASWGVRFER